MSGGGGGRAKRAGPNKGTAEAGARRPRRNDRTDDNRNSNKRGQGPPALSSSEPSSPPSFLTDLKDNNNPGTLIVLPFVALFGIDLVLNIVAITKRSLEFFVLGKAPNADPWF